MAGDDSSERSACQSQMTLVSLKRSSGQTAPQHQQPFGPRIRGAAPSLNQSHDTGDLAPRQRQFLAHPHGLAAQGLERIRGQLPSVDLVHGQ